MKVYKICYIEDSDAVEVFDLIDIVRERNLPLFVRKMVDEGQICEETVKDFMKKHKRLPQTRAEAVELLKDDGYDVEQTIVW